MVEIDQSGQALHKGDCPDTARGLAATILQAQEALATLSPTTLFEAAAQPVEDGPNPIRDAILSMMDPESREAAVFASHGMRAR